MCCKKLSLSLLTAFFFIANSSFAQVRISGNVYDNSRVNPLAGVSVMGKTGTGTITDSSGHYSILLANSDSIYFSYLGKSTAKIAVSDIPPGMPLDMSLEVNVTFLPSVLVKPRDYLTDSIENRKEYQKIFDFGGDSYVNGAKMKSKGGFGVGLDFDILLNPAKERRMQAFHDRLVKEEEDKFVDHRFNPALVKKITGIQPPILDSFMHLFRPTATFIKSFQTEYEYYNYISDCGKSFMEMWNYNHHKQ